MYFSIILLKSHYNLKILYIRVNFYKLEFHNFITHIFLEIITVFKDRIIREITFINIHFIF